MMMAVTIACIARRTALVVVWVGVPALITGAKDAMKLITATVLQARIERRRRSRTVSVAQPASEATADVAITDGAVTVIEFWLSAHVTCM